MSAGCLLPDEAIYWPRELNAAVGSCRSNAKRCLTAVDCRIVPVPSDTEPDCSCHGLELVCRNASTATTTTAALSSKHPLASADVGSATRRVPAERGRGSRARSSHPTPSRGGWDFSVPAAPARAFSHPYARAAPTSNYDKRNSRAWAVARELLTRATLPRGRPQRHKRAISTAKRWTPTSTAPSTRRKQLDQRAGPMCDGGPQQRELLWPSGASPF